MSDSNKAKTDKQGSLSRRTIVTGGGIGLLTVAASAQAQQATTSVVPGQPPVKATEGGQFREALRKIASDTAYRNKATQDPKIVIQDFKLSMQDVRALRNSAVLSGVDVSKVDAMLATAETGPLAADINIRDCCCCCCCGQTGIEFATTAT